MRTCLLAIAKDEDDYIQEWVDYHLKLGFGKIYIIQDNWKANIREDPRIELLDCRFGPEIPIDCIKQEKVYSEFIQERHDEFDWIAVFDLDEFLCLKKYGNVDSFLATCSNVPSVGVHWKFFGDSDLTGFSSDGDKSTIRRFRHSQRGCDNTFKSIYNMNRLREMFGGEILCNENITSIHTFRQRSINGINLYDLQYGVDGHSRISLDAKDCNTEELRDAGSIAYLAHYRRTYEEFVRRHGNPSHIWWKNFNAANGGDMKKVFEKLNPKWFNEEENSDLFNFMYGNDEHIG